MTKVLFPAMSLAVAVVAGIGSGAWSSQSRLGGNDHRAPAGSERSTAMSAFGWLAATEPPATWHQVAGPSGLGSLSVPPRFRRIRGDPGTISAALLGPGGNYLGYLNVTPRQGAEQLQGWAAFRLAHLRQDDASSVRRDAAITSVGTSTARRSCVIDDYVTKVGHHHFHEVACLIVTGSFGSVVVAATPSGDPAHVWSELERAVAAYPLRSARHPH
jgi:hypothetical protein